MVMSQVQPSNAKVCVVCEDGSSVKSCLCIQYLCLWTASPRAEPACWTVEFLRFGGVLIQLALFSSGASYVWTSPPFLVKTVQRWFDLDHSVCSTRLFGDGGTSGLTFPIWLVFRNRPLLAAISNHQCCDWREAHLLHLLHPPFFICMHVGSKCNSQNQYTVCWHNDSTRICSIYMLIKKTHVLNVFIIRDNMKWNYPQRHVCFIFMSHISDVN